MGRRLCTRQATWVSTRTCSISQTGTQQFHLGEEYQNIGEPDDELDGQLDGQPDDELDGQLDSELDDDLDGQPDGQLEEEYDDTSEDDDEAHYLTMMI